MSWRKFWRDVRCFAAGEPSPRNVTLGEAHIKHLAGGGNIVLPRNTVKITFADLGLEGMLAAISSGHLTIDAVGDDFVYRKEDA